MPESLGAPRGTQDFFPPESARWIALEARIHALAARFGYGEIRTPIFESTELFVRGVGETTDIVEKEMYTFTDRGERSMTLRPELTAPVVRAALEHHLFDQGPLRLYYIGPIFRYERPQKGRYRQAHQFGIECFGFAGPEADFEVISLAWELVRDYGITDATLQLNSIGDDACRPRYREALLAHFRPHARRAVAKIRSGAWSAIRCGCSTVKIRRDLRVRRSAPTFESVLCDGVPRTLRGAARLSRRRADSVRRRIRRSCAGSTTTRARSSKSSSSVLGAQSTVCGGGRYDGLVRSLGGPDVPARRLCAGHGALS